jgi:hypothetical protein
MNKKAVESLSASESNLQVSAAMAAKMRPEYWVQQAGEKYPSSEELTGWYPDNVQPARKGWYERYFVTSVHLHHWDGRQWTVDGSLPYARSLGNPLRPSWRGLARPAMSRRKTG